jgi:hypothetical protein
MGCGVSASFFPVLGVEPILGHSFTEDDDRTGTSVVIITFDLWRRRFGEDATILGRTIRLSDTPYELIGVMPRTFIFRTRDVDYWVPIHLSPAQAADRGSHNLGRRTAESWRQPWGCTRRHDARCADAPAAISGDQRSRRHQARACGCRPHRQHQSRIRNTYGRHRRGSSNRLRQSRQPAPVARGKPPIAAGGPRVARRDARGTCPTDGSRGTGAITRGRRDGPCLGRQA